MCGIAGFWQGRPQNEDVIRSAVLRMTKALAYRGPDDEGVWVDARVGIGLGHRRLSIIDVSPEGHQPMVSANDRFIITYNGEIYNYVSVQRRLESLGHVFRGHSDTEIILAAIAEWGLDGALRQFVGMYAFALWDQAERELHFVRDRLGIKPLYVYQNRGVVAFGSELKALLEYSEFKPDIERSVLANYLRYRYVPAPGCIFGHTIKLLPGHILTIKDPARSSVTSRPYWSAQQVVAQGLANPIEGSDQELIEKLDSLLREAVSVHMLADVPLGGFLSGGIDSSTVVAMMQSVSNRPVKTFTVGFEEGNYNEALNARVVAEHLGTDHHEIYVSSKDAEAVLPSLPEMFDEPFSDPSQIPTFLISRMARQSVKVCLSGDGGDEVFGGYNRYLWVPRVWQWVNRIPAFSYPLAIGMVRGLSPQTLDAVYEAIEPALPRSMRTTFVGDKLHKLPSRSVSSMDGLYRSVASTWESSATLLLDGLEAQERALSVSAPDSVMNGVDRLMSTDLVTYLPDDILTKLDRCSMAVSLETRVPLLDHRIVEFAWRLPQTVKFRYGQGKWILRQVLNRYVPSELFDRPKMGFDLPIDAWLRGPLRDWAQDLLSEERLRRGGLLHVKRVQKLFSEHLSGKKNRRDILWALLMFQAWQERWC